MDLEPASIHLFLALKFDLLIITYSVVLIFLLLCSALISGSEIAFFSLSQTQLNDQTEKTKGNSLVVKLLERPKRLLATILITNNFINILIVLLFAGLSELIFGDKDFSINWWIISISSYVIKFTIEVVLVTFLILLFGEVLPKVYASRNSLKFSKIMAKPVHVLTTLLSVFSLPLIRLTGLVENRLSGKNSDFSVAKLSQALELTSEETTTKEEKKILQGIVTFGNTETVQIMKPRMDIFAISDEETYKEVLDKILQKGYSRNPVYHESIDNIIGVLYAKDLLGHLDKTKFKWQDLLREPFFVPENKKLDDLLSEFQDKKNHLAIVVDEYGGTSGIVTLEDVIEEIVGDINDEFDEDELLYSKLDANNYVFDGKTTIKSFCKVLNIDDESIFEEEKGESETLAGFILEISGKFPRKGENVNFHNFSFTVESLDKRRIKQVKVTRLHA